MPDTTFTPQAVEAIEAIVGQIRSQRDEALVKLAGANLEYHEALDAESHIRDGYADRMGSLVFSLLTVMRMGARVTRDLDGLGFVTEHIVGGVVMHPDGEVRVHT